MKELLQSKKVRVAVAAILVWLGARFGLQLDASDVEPIVYILITLIGAQGIADAGKERAKVETQAAKEGVSTARVEVTIPPPVASTAPAAPLPPPAPTVASLASQHPLGRPRARDAGQTPETRDLGPMARRLRDEAIVARKAATPKPEADE